MHVSMYFLHLVPPLPPPPHYIIMVKGLLYIVLFYHIHQHKQHPQLVLLPQLLQSGVDVVRMERVVAHAGQGWGRRGEGRSISAPKQVMGEPFRPPSRQSSIDNRVVLDHFCAIPLPT